MNMDYPKKMKRRLKSLEYIGKTKRPQKQQVYHNKWQFVSEDYKGFDVKNENC